MKASKVVSARLGRGLGVARMISVCLLTGGMAMGDISTFAKLDGIEGESQHVDHEGWMDAVGLGAKVWLQTTVVDGRSVATPSKRPFVVRKRIDKASPYLTLALLKGREFEELQVEQFSEGRLIGCYRMRGVRLISSKLESRPEDEQLLEEVAFGFDVMEWHSFRDGDDGRLIHIGSTWDFAIGEGGILDLHGGEAPTIDPIAPVQARPGEILEIKIALNSPSGDGLVFSALPSEQGLLKVLGVEGTGDSRTLQIQVSSLLNGTDSLTLSVSDGTRSSTRQLPILIEGERTPYETYVEGFLAEQLKLDPTLADLLRDPDKDRLTNAMEFFLGTDPGSYTRSDEAISFDQEKDKEGTRIRMRYFRRFDTLGLTAEFEGSKGLNEWLVLGPTTSPSLETIVLPGGDGVYVPMESTVTIPDGSDETYFMRFSVEGFF